MSVIWTGCECARCHRTSTFEREDQTLCEQCEKRPPDAPLRFNRMSGTLLLIVIALILTLAGIIWPRFPLVAVGVLLICIALLVGQR